MNNEKVKLLLNWNHFGEHLSSCMTKLMTDSSYSDIIITTGDKHMIYSHRFVLGNSSKYFQRLFKNVSSQCGIQLVVALPEIKYEIFKILMNYMYKGETQVPHELLPSVIKAGQFLEINGLVNFNEGESSDHRAKPSLRGFRPKSSLRDFRANRSPTDSNQLKGVPSTPRDDVRPWENTHSSSINVLPPDRVNSVGRKTAGEDFPSKSAVNGEKGKENLSKLSKCRNENREKDMIQLPLKRKSYMRKTSPLPSSSSSLSSERCPRKKLQKKQAIKQEMANIDVKEKKENKSPANENKNPDNQDLEENITIKTEIVDETEGSYSELQCEFCHEVYSNPPEWVRHMTEQHGNKGFQSYKDPEKNAGGDAAFFTCVVCSAVSFSPAEWAKHMTEWHSKTTHKHDRKHKNW